MLLSQKPIRLLLVFEHGQNRTHLAFNHKLHATFATMSQALALVPVPRKHHIGTHGGGTTGCDEVEHQLAMYSRNSQPVAARATRLLCIPSLDSSVCTNENTKAFAHVHILTKNNNAKDSRKKAAWRQPDSTSPHAPPDHRLPRPHLGLGGHLRLHRRSFSSRLSWHRRRGWEEDSARRPRAGRMGRRRTSPLVAAPSSLLRLDRNPQSRGGGGARPTRSLITAGPVTAVRSGHGRRRWMGGLLSLRRSAGGTPAPRPAPTGCMVAWYCRHHSVLRVLGAERGLVPPIARAM